MTRATVHRKNDRKVLEYILDDFLELKTSLEAAKTVPLKRLLLSEGLDSNPPFPIEGFLLAGHLVVIGSSNPHILQSLIFLSPADGRIRVRSL